MQEDRHLAIWWCWCPKEQCYAAGGYVGGGASFVGDTLFELQEKLENSLAVLGYPPEAPVNLLSVQLHPPVTDPEYLWR